MVTKDLGMVTAYAYAVAGGYTGTEAQFEQLMADLAIVVDDFDNFSVTVTTLPAGSSATASYSDGVLSLGIPKGDKGDKGNTGETGLTPHLTIGTVETTVQPSVTITGTVDDPVLNFGLVKGDKGDTGEVSEAELAEILENYARTDGYYSDLTAGDAEQLISSMYVEDSEPYNYRTTGGSADVGNREYVDAIVGGTVAWNQLLKNADFASGMHNWAVGSNATASVSNGVLTAVANGTPTGNQYVTQGGLVIPSGHKMLWSAEIASNNAQITVQGAQSSPWTNVFAQSVSVTSTLAPKAGVVAVGSGNTVNGFFFNFDNKENVIIKSPQVFDLTQMFGSTIADYIYSLEQANEGAGVAWFRKLFNKPYYAYNAGELKSVSGLASHDMTGFNQWDEEWEVGGISSDTGINDNNQTITIRAKNPFPVLPNTTYRVTIGQPPISVAIDTRFYDADMNYLVGTSAAKTNQTFVTPANAAYMRFVVFSQYGTVYHHDICINLSWSGWRNGDYEPYEKHSYPLDSDLTLRGIPKLDANNNLYYDGDVYEPDGTVTRKYKAVTIDGSDTFSYQYNGTLPSGYIACFINFADKAYGVYNMLSDKFVSNNNSELYTVCGRVNNGGVQYVLPSTVTASNEGCKAWFTSNPTTLVYELETPTTETADPFNEIQICDDFGTEEYVSTSIVPVGHSTRYPANLRDKLQHLPDLADDDGYYMIGQSNKQMHLELFRIPKAPTTDGTYVLQATVSSGTPTYTWVNPNAESEANA